MAFSVVSMSQNCYPKSFYADFSREFSKIFSTEPDTLTTVSTCVCINFIYRMIYVCFFLHFSSTSCVNRIFVTQYNDICVGLYDWDLSLKAKTDGTFGLEGLKYGSPREYEGGAGQSGGTGQNASEEVNQESGGGNARVDKDGEAYGGGVRACS